VHKKRHAPSKRPGIVATNLKIWMGRMGVSQPQLASLSGLTQPTVNRVLNGKQEPGERVILAFADGLKIDPGQLTTRNLLEPAAAIYGSGRVPLISWTQAGRWSTLVDNFQPGDAEDWVFCAKPHSQSTFALTVRGDSMREQYQEGETIFVDPAREPRHNSDIVLRLEVRGEDTTTFKRLRRTHEGDFLLALNPHYPEPLQRLPRRAHICGVVIWKSWDPEQEG
jgi:SOS-response transcriptional repressor LexA